MNFSKNLSTFIWQNISQRLLPNYRFLKIFIFIFFFVAILANSTMFLFCKKFQLDEHKMVQLSDI